MCSYRNCNNKVSGRKNKNFCNVNCRKNEQTYRKRELDKFKSDKEHIFKLIEDLNNPLIDLYKLIYK